MKDGTTRLGILRNWSRGRKMIETDETSLTIRRAFDAPRERVLH